MSPSFLHYPLCGQLRYRINCLCPKICHRHNYHHFSRRGTRIFQKMRVTKQKPTKRMSVFHVHEGLFVLYSKLKKHQNCNIITTPVLILLSLWSFSTIFSFKTADVGQSLTVCILVCLILYIFPDGSNIPHTVNCKGLSNFGFLFHPRSTWRTEVSYS
jgi:hypothetical protein